MQAFDYLDDKEGRKWKRRAFIYAAKSAMQPVVRQAKKNAPVGKHKLLKQKITLKTTFKARPKKGNLQLDSYTTYGNNFEKAFRSVRKPSGKAKKSGGADRYPYIIEAGKRKKGSGKGSAAIKSNPYQKEAMTSMKARTYKTFGASLSRSLKVFADNSSGKFIQLSTREYNKAMKSKFWEM